MPLTSDELVALTAAVALEISSGIEDEDARYMAHRHPTFRHQNPGLVREVGASQARAIGGDRTYRPALRDGRTVFESRVFNAGDRDRVLISGINNAKIGRKVTKGAWSGMPIYTLSLEERATCPRSCVVYDCCYGNAMPMAVRFRYDPALVERLYVELNELSKRHKNGFVVRLHVLGDFPDADYVRQWMRWSHAIPELRVWGYTAHPRDGEIGKLIRLMNSGRAERWMVRFSVAPEIPHAPMQAAVVWEKPATLETINDTVICPQELGKTSTCGSCALCWSPEAAHLRIVFFGHGNRHKRPS